MTESRDPQKRLNIAHVIGRMNHEQWKRFVHQVFGEKEFSEFQDKEEDLLLSSKIELVESWMKYDGAVNTLGQLKNLVKRFVDDVVRSKSDEPSTKRRQGPKYPTKHGKGCVLIISNSFERSQTKCRKFAADLDKKHMESLWHEKLECHLLDGKSHMNQTAEQMVKLLKKMASLDAREKGYDYIVVVISTHGGLKTEKQMQQISADGKKNQQSEQQENSERGRKTDVHEGAIGTDRNSSEWSKTIQDVSSKPQEEELEESANPTVEVLLGDDEIPIREKDIMEYFRNDQAKGLHDVPKFFILDYCRGIDSHTGVARSKAGAINPSEYGDSLGEDGDEDSERETSALLPIVSDVLVVHATHHSYVAYEWSEKGSWLISHIADTFEKNYQCQHAVDMLTQVNAKFKEAEANVRPGKMGLSKRKVMSVFQSSLVQPLYFGSPSNERQKYAS